MAAIERVIEAVLSGTDELLLLISTYTQIMDFLGRMCDRQWNKTKRKTYYCCGQASYPSWNKG